MSYTPISDTELKTDIIEHINEDHPDAVLDIVRTYANAQAESAEIVDLFQEGAWVRIGRDTAGQETLIPFLLQDAGIDEQIHYLVFHAAVKQGKPIGAQKNQFFTVLATEKASPNMQRLILQSAAALPENEPGYALYFMLKKLEHKNPASTGHRSKYYTRWKNLLIMWWIRRISSQRRHKLVQSMYQGMRYYTVRETRKSQADNPYHDIAVVDVFLHGDTQGSLWAASLQKGDLLRSTADYHEHTDHLQTGKSVLIADETALPTVAALLQQWKNPVAPIVISITSSSQDQIYLPDSLMPAATALHRMDNDEQLADKIIRLLHDIPEIDAVWGACETEVATKIRKFFRNERHLIGKQNRVKGYWRKEKEK